MDPFGRSTPRGTITRFTEAVHRGDLVSAARYLQLTASQRPAGGTLARQLSELMDRHFHGAVSALNGSPTGSE